MNAVGWLREKLKIKRSLSVSDAVESLLKVYAQIQTYSQTQVHRVPISLWREYESIDIIIRAGLGSVRSIGQQLHEAGGRERMSEAYSEFVRRTMVVGAPHHLKEMWDGIGEWTARD